MAPSIDDLPIIWVVAFHSYVSLLECKRRWNMLKRSVQKWVTIMEFWLDQVVAGEDSAQYSTWEIPAGTFRFHHSSYP